MTMKILLSPSKTQKMTNNIGEPLQAPLFLSESQELVEIVNSLNDEELMQRLHIPKTQAAKVIEMYRHFGYESGNAIESYTGEAFKALRQGWTKESLLKAQNKLYIFSALYGILRPLDEIHPYRLDMTMSILENQSLIAFWKEKINAVLHQEKEIVSLASQEFEKLLEIPYTRVMFCYTDGKRVHTVLAKQMRGMMAQYIIDRDIQSITDLKKVELNGFYFKEHIDNVLYFYCKKV